jgi:hypothetical protein
MAWYRTWKSSSAVDHIPVVSSSTGRDLSIASSAFQSLVTGSGVVLEVIFTAELNEVSIWVGRVKNWIGRAATSKVNVEVSLALEALGWCNRINVVAVGMSWSDRGTGSRSVDITSEAPIALLVNIARCAMKSICVSGLALVINCRNNSGTFRSNARTKHLMLSESLFALIASTS